MYSWRVGGEVVNRSINARIGDADLVAEDEPAGKGDEAGEEDKDGHLPRVISVLVVDDAAAAATRHDGRRNKRTRENYC